MSQREPWTKGAATRQTIVRPPFRSSKPSPHRPAPPSDVVRSSAVFHSLDTLNDAIVALMDSNGTITVVRVKDRITYPLDSGYR